MQTIKNKSLYSRSAMLALSLVLFSATGIAQQAKPSKPCFAPGSGPEFTVTFSGQDASKLSGANAAFRTDTAVPADMSFLTAQFGTPSATATSPGLFTISVRVPENAISGKYSLFRINANTLYFGVEYQAGSDFTAPPAFEVCNPNSFKKPTIKNVTEKS